MWCRTSINDYFDRTVRTSDSTLVTNPADMFLFHEFHLHFPKFGSGPYRDDALLVVIRLSQFELVCTRKLYITISVIIIYLLFSIIVGKLLIFRIIFQIITQLYTIPLIKQMNTSN